MQLQIGTNLTLPASEAYFTHTRRGWIENGITLGFTERWDIFGRLQVADTGQLDANQAAVTQAIQIRQAAFVPGIDLVFLTNNGGVSAYALRNSTSFGGTRVVEPPHFPDSRGAQYSTFVTWKAAMEADYVDQTLGMIDWQETISFTGTGGPQFGFLLTLNGPPQQQTLRLATTVRAVQSGFALAMFDFPTPPPPSFPFCEHLELRQGSLTSPQRWGRGSAYAASHYKATWAYYFESSGALIGNPNIGPTP